MQLRLQDDHGKPLPHTPMRGPDNVNYISDANGYIFIPLPPAPPVLRRTDRP